MDMSVKDILRAATAAGLFLLPLAAQAQSAPGYSGEITTGVGYQSSNSAAFGRYTGKADKGFSGIGSFRLDYAAPPDSGKADYFKAEGDNFDADGHARPPEATVKTGEQGKWGVNVEYDGITSTTPGRR